MSGQPTEPWGQEAKKGWRDGPFWRAELALCTVCSSLCGVVRCPQRVHGRGLAERVVVVGLARSGGRRRGSRVARGRWPRTASRRGLEAEALSLRVDGRRLELGGIARRPSPADLVVVSPGVPWDLPELAARAGRRAGDGRAGAGRRVSSEGRVAAVTGTKGKSTPPRRSGPCCGRRGATCAWAATSGRR